MGVVIRSATLEDTYRFAPVLREADKQELYAVSGRTPEAAIYRAIQISSAAYSVFAEGEPVMIWGVAPASPGATERLPVGIPWMMGTSLLENPEISRKFLRMSRGMVSQIQSAWPILTNVTDARNKVHHRWLSWCGFKYLRTVPVGPLNTPFYEFIRI